MDKSNAETAEKRVILEMGTGNDRYGGDYTKAACRAVHDALHHSSIVLFRSRGFDSKDMRVLSSPSECRSRIRSTVPPSPPTCRATAPPFTAA